MPRKLTIARRRRLRTAQETQYKWAGIFQRAFNLGDPFTAEDRRRYPIHRVSGRAGVKYPESKRWGTDSNLHDVIVFRLEVVVDTTTVEATIPLNHVGPKQEFTIETRAWNFGDWLNDKKPDPRTVDWVKNRVEAWAYDVIRREVAPRRINRFKEELIAAAWAPARVERWLEAGVELEAL